MIACRKHVYVSKHNLTLQYKIILLMITDCKELHHVATK